MNDLAQPIVLRMRHPLIARASLLWDRRPRWGVLSEDGIVYGVGRWKDGRKRHDGALWLALREARLLRKGGEPRARVARQRPHDPHYVTAEIARLAKALRSKQ